MDIAVVGVVFRGNKFLLLKRNSVPLNWCPPCGRLEENENPVDAIKREIMEEAGLNVRVVMPVEVKTVMHDNKKLFSVGYMCEALSEDVVLSYEHKAYCWVAIDELKNYQDETDFDILHWPFFLNQALYWIKCSDKNKT